MQAQSEPEAAWRSAYFGTGKGPGTSPLFNLVQDSELEPQVCVVLKAGCCRSEPRAQAASGRPGRGCPANGGAASCPGPGSGPTPSEPLPVAEAGVLTVGSRRGVDVNIQTSFNVQVH